MEYKKYREEFFKKLKELDDNSEDKKAVSHMLKFSANEFSNHNDYVNYKKAKDKTMTTKHKELVKKLAKPGTDIKESLSADDAHVLHMLILLSGEVGELQDCIKKNIIYRKDLDEENLIEELGDIEFALEGIRAAYSVTREECLQANIDKRTKRYGERYSDQSAQERRDKGNK